jgi:probable F420-dependent oxidoreductase
VTGLVEARPLATVSRAAGKGGLSMKFTFAMPHLLRLKASSQPWEHDVTGPDQQRVARAAEQQGYDMLAVPEHFVITKSHVELSGPHHFHAAAAQGFFAGATERIRVNSCIAILPLQHPIVTAKALSTVDWQSGGRAIATFGVGWLKDEFDILGVDFAARGRMADEYLAAIVELWTSDDPVFEGEFVSFRDVAFEPKPVQQPHLPIWLGGDADAVLRRAARFADGWWPFLTKPENIPARLEYLKTQETFTDRPFEVMYGMSTSRVGEGHVVVDDPKARPGMSLDEIVDRLSWFHELGVTMSSVPIPPMKGIDEYLEYTQWVIEEVKPRVP